MLALETIERGVERTLFDEQRATGDLLDARQHAEAVQGAEREGLENQQVQGSRQEISAGAHASLSRLDEQRPRQGLNVERCRFSRAIVVTRLDSAGVSGPVTAFPIEMRVLSA